MITPVGYWIAPGATIIAAIMTAGNFGTRITGWGFVIFLIGSLAWSVEGAATGQPPLLWTNAFLSIVNVIGIWRWLGRKARYEEGGQAAAEISANAEEPALVSLTSLSGSQISDRGGQEAGKLVDVMIECDTARIAYVVVSEGGVAGVGERLHALAPRSFQLSQHGVTVRHAASDVAAMPELEADSWPGKI